MNTVLKPVGTEKLCKNCHWWRSRYKETNYRQGYGFNDCHLHGPEVMENEYRGRSTTVWPTTEGSDFCGDFEMEMVASDHS